MNDIRPLQLPSNWPPPPFPEPSSRELWWWRIPVIGWFVAYFMYLCRISEHRKRSLFPLEEEIVRQLSSRPSFQWYPPGSDEAEIVSALAEAVAHEKGIELPSIHPDDPTELLLWGAYDDLTPLVFRMKIRKRLTVEFPNDDWLLQSWNGHWPVSKLVCYMKSCIVSRNTTSKQ